MELQLKKLRFDEENIRLTNHPAEKDYGLLTIPESKTPYPRHEDPVEARDLRKRLQDALEKANVMLKDRHNGDNTSDTFSQRLSNPFEDDSEDVEKRHTEFLKKRKQFYQSEFLITRQKRMSSEMHPPGPSIGNNWRINDVNEYPSSPSMSGTPARITSIISRQRLPNPGSLVNQETLREIAEHMTNSTHWFASN